MLDQATRLRAIMSRRLAQPFASPRSAPLVLICGSQRGVGVTTLCAILAAAYRQHGAIELVDGSRRAASELHLLWQTADEVIVVTTADSSAVMDAYATIKGHTVSLAATPIHVLFNRASEGRPHKEAFARLAHSCRRFLGVEARLLGEVPHVANLSHEAPHAAPLIVRSSTCPAAQAMAAIAAVLAAEFRLTEATVIA